MVNQLKREYKHQWYLNNRERLKARLLERKEEIRKQRRQYRAKNGERLRVAFAKWAEENPERNKERAKKWRAKNPGKYKQGNMKTNAKTAEQRRMDPRVGMWRAAKKRAQRKGWEFNLVASELVVPKVCPVLGIPLKVAVGSHSPGSPSLDRIDNALGYVKGNVEVISYRANTIKGDATPEELMAVAKYAVDNRW